MVKIRIFLSSTVRDLQEHRLLLIRHAGIFGYQIIAMEEFSAQDGNALRVSLNELSLCDVFVGVYAKRYGYIPETEPQSISITEQEYLAACTLGKPRLIFIADEDYIVQDQLLHAYRNDDNENIKAKILSFMQRVSTERVWEKFTTPPDLAGRFCRALSKWEGWRMPEFPAPSTRLIGQTGMQEKIFELLRQQNFIGLTGMGGSGKTLMAQFVAFESKSYYRGGILWFRLSSADSNSERVVHNFLQVASQCHPAGRLTPHEKLTPSAVHEWLSESPGKMLVIIDDVWNVQIMKEIMKSIPSSVHILVTTRDAGIVARLQNFRAIEITPLNESDSTSLLRDRVGDIILPGVLKRIAALVHGHPLALELAAGLIRKLGVDYTEEKMVNVLKFQINNATTPQGEDREDELKPLYATLSLTYQELSESAKERFRVLSVTPQNSIIPFDLVGGLWELEDNDEATQDNLHHLTGLFVNLGLLNRNTTNDFQIHPLLHSYAKSLVNAEEKYGFEGRYFEFLHMRLKDAFKDIEGSWSYLSQYLPHVHEIGSRLYNIVEKEVGDINNLTKANNFRFPLKDEEMGLTVFIIRNLDFQRSIWNRVYKFVSMVQDYIHRRTQIGIEARQWLCMGLVAVQNMGSYEKCVYLIQSVSLWHSERGEGSQARSYLDLVSSWFQQQNDSLKKASNLNSEGWNLYLTGQWEAARIAYADALKITTDPGLLGSIYNNMGVLLQQTGEYEESVEYLRKSIELDKNNERNNLARNFRNLGLSLRNKGDYDEAIEQFNLSREISKQNGNKFEEEQAINGMGTAYLAQGNYIKAKEMANSALVMARDLGIPKAISSNQFLLAEIDYETGNYIEAISNYDEVIKVATTLEDKKGLGDALNNLARVYISLNNFEEGLSLYHQALHISIEMNDEVGAAITRSCIGHTLLILGKQQESLQMLLEALPVLQRVKKRQLEYDVLINLVTIYNRQGDSRTAENYRLRSAEIFGQINSIYHQISSLKKEAEEFEERKKYPDVILKLLEAIDLCHGHPFLEQESARCRNYLGMIYMSLRQFDKAQALLLDAAAIFNRFEQQQDEAGVWVNLGEMFRTFGDKTRALEYFNQALPILRSGNHYNALADVLNNIALVLNAESEQLERIALLEECVALKLKINNFEGAAKAYSNIYIGLLNHHKTDHAITYIYKTLELVHKIPVPIARIDFELEISNDLINIYDNVSEGLPLLKLAMQEMEDFQIESSTNGSTIADIGKRIQRAELLSGDGPLIFKESLEKVWEIFLAPSLNETNQLLQEYRDVISFPGFEILQELLPGDADIDERDSIRLISDFIYALRWKGDTAGLKIKEAKLLFDEGTQHFKNQHVDLAKPLIQEAFDKGINTEGIHLCLGIIYLYEDKLDIAEEHITEVHSLYPSNAEAYYWQGRINLHNDSVISQENFSEAIRLRKPMEAHVVPEKGPITIKTHGPYADSFRKKQKTYEVNPTVDETYYWRAVAYCKTGNFQEAIADLDYAISLDTNQYMYHFFRAHAYQQLNEFKKAENDLYTCTELQPYIPELYKARANVFLADNDSFGALEDLDWLIHLDQSVPNLFLRGQVLFECGYFEDATNDFEQVLEKDADALGAAYWLGLIMISESKYPAAYEIFEKLATRENATSNDHLWKAISACCLGSTGDAGKIIRQLHLAEPEDMGIGFWLCVISQLQQEPVISQRAFSTTAALVQQSDNDCFALRIKARLTLLDCRTNEALEHYKEVMDACDLRSLQIEKVCLSVLAFLFSPMDSIKLCAEYFNEQLSIKMEQFESK